jgi:tripartite-type tricarboxylate transporter receptor subunit TctC
MQKKHILSSTRIFRDFLILIYSTFLLSQAFAENYPNKPIKIIVPFPAGGGTDIVIRAISPKLSINMGQPIYIENKSGASTLIGTELASKSDADGYTLLFTSSAFTANSALTANLPYDPLKSFIPIGSAALHPFLLVAHPSIKASSLRELLSYAKENPGKISYASVGDGSSQHLGMELILKNKGVDIVHVPYRGSAPAMNDLLGGQVQIMLNGVSPTISHIKNGKLKVLATDSPERVNLLPEVPTLNELGVDDYKITTWSGLLAPAGTPKDIIKTLESNWIKTISDPSVMKMLSDRGLIPTSLNSKSFFEFLHKDLEEWKNVVKEHK